jgi:hypothetical protein
MEKASASPCIHALDCGDFLTGLDSVDGREEKLVRANGKLL